MVNMNIRYMTARKMGIPRARLSITRSMESERLADAWPVRVRVAWVRAWAMP
jgi:hypothetical protein